MFALHQIIKFVFKCFYFSKTSSLLSSAIVSTKIEFTNDSKKQNGIPS